MRKLNFVIVSMLVLSMLLAACGGGATQTTAPTSAPQATSAPATSAPTMAPTTGATSAPSASGGKIALLLPETKTARYETADRPDFEAKMKELCPNCEIIYSNANQDANAQLSQAEAALTNGAQVLVLDPVELSRSRRNRR